MAQNFFNNALDVESGLNIELNRTKE